MAPKFTRVDKQPTQTVFDGVWSDVDTDNFKIHFYFSYLLFLKQQSFPDSGVNLVIVLIHL